jgi:chromatin assembly factor 1 subunit B
LFEVPTSVQEESKENPSALPYRSVFAVLTLDSVLIYDTHHDQPLAVARGLHYAGLTDCCWSQDGLHLMVCSTDGYISILSFQYGELGQVYTHPDVLAPLTSDIVNSKDATSSQLSPMLPPEELPQIPPCEPGQAAVLEARPTKRAKTLSTTTLVSTSVDTPPATTKIQITPAKRTLLATETEQVGDAVHRLTLENYTITSETTGGCLSSTDANHVKKKKRIQPVLVSK